MPAIRSLPVLSLLLCLVGFAHAQERARPGRPNSDDLKKIESALPEKAPATPKRARKVLVFTRATGFVHSSIPVAAKAVELMGNKTGAYSTVVSDDVESFAPEKLKEFDAVVMLSTTGELFVPKGMKAGELVRDAGKPLPPELERARALRQSLVEFVKSGRGIVGVHAATDSSYQWKEYGEMIGGYFNGHPWGKISLRLDDPANPVNAAFAEAEKAAGKPVVISDEIYTFKTDPYHTRERLRVLISIDLEASGIDQGFNRPADHDYAVSWLNRYGEGRVFYTLLGHQEATWWNPAALKHCLAGLQYAIGDLEADDEPSGPLPPERLAANLKAAARGWQPVARDESWYKEQKDVKEQVFAGILEAVPDAGGPGILQRTRHYKLRERMVFTAGKKHPALEKLVEQRVEIRGKAVDLELEGQSLKELWPGAVRPIDPD